MNFRRIVLSIFTVLFVLFGSILSFAQSNISKDEAKKISENVVKNYLGIQLDNKFESRLELEEDNYRDISVWSMNWNKHEDDIDVDIDVEIDSTNGKIVGFRYDTWDENRLVATMTKEEAKKIADDFLKKINPNESTKVRLADDSYFSRNFRGPNYNFVYVRQENGLDFEQNTIEIEVNGNTGKVESYRLNWDYNMKFDENKDVISKDKAQQILKDNVDMELVYYDVDKNYDGNSEDIKLSYVPQCEKGFLVDAKSGKVVGWDGLNNELKYKDIKEEEKEKIYEKSTQPKERSTELTEKEAKDIIESIAKEIIKDDFEIDRLRYEENSSRFRARGKNIWRANFDVKNKDLDGSIYINALTGELISFDSYNFDDEEEFDPKLSWSEGYDKSVDILSKYYGYNIKDINTKLIEEDSYVYINGRKINTQTYHYNFARVNDKIDYQNNSIRVGIDVKTGDITEIEYRWDKEAKFPTVENVIDKDKAKDIYFDNADIKLGYFNIENGKDIENTKVLYSIKDMYMIAHIDSVTGEVLDYSGNKFEKNDDKNYSDKVKDHWAKKELTILSDNKIIDLKEFEPNKELSKIDAIKMVVNAKGYNTYRANDIKDLKFKDIKDNDEDMSYIKLAVEYGFVENKEENFNKDSKITRQEMAKMIVKLIDKEEMANMKGVYSLEFSDEASIDNNYKGYVAVCKGLGIINGGNSSFRPKDNATMTEMAVSIYKALSNPEIQ
ncbi:YcdB/YcdC domain-containing protein [Tepidibacter hydrothermalis]|uniref:S-layer homology domain-containing protein n=1 Tax=Tepidibacter hydrothermalis TaxID=3036126 RepID=A0ABY8EI58_9FIRM|nr:YcdB/YcdC domain-containing protein [Tepidibacter hydrothermalis]WFD10545.1 S-layer homology domain-containing protein [Tepidibacter hydrothermalis]